MNNRFLFNIRPGVGYPVAPFHPPETFPEMAGAFRATDSTNRIYAMVRDLFIEARYDASNLSSARWNPFRGLVTNGQTVVIKPNLVYQEIGTLRGKHSLTTHASVLRPILDYLYLLQRADAVSFRVVIGDVPLQSADFARIIEETGLGALLSYYREECDFDVELLDLRPEIAISDENNFISKRVKNTGDPRGYVSVHLNKSFLDEIVKDSNKLSVGDYDDVNTSSKHAATGEHYYLLPKTVLEAALFINVPKMKTHQKAGVTVAMKNLIGIVGDKSWVPHYRKGAPSKGGDEYSNEHAHVKLLNAGMRRLLQGRSRVLWSMARGINRKIVKKLLRSAGGNGAQLASSPEAAKDYRWIMDGAWFGNDTLWRPILDLNFLLFCADADGTIQNSVQRNYLCVSDGIVAGEGDGPLRATPKPAGLLALCENPVLNDLCCARLMGFDWRRLPFLSRATDLKDLFAFDAQTGALEIGGSVAGDRFASIDFDGLPNLGFLSPPGWRNHIEIKRPVSKGFE